MQKISAEQFKKQYGKDAYSGYKKPTQQPGYFQRVGTSLKETATGLGQDIQKQAEVGGQAQNRGDYLEEAVALGRGGLRSAGAFAKSALTPLMEAPGIKQAAEFVGEKIADTAPMQKFAEWAGRHPEAAKDIEDTLDIAGLLGTASTVKPLVNGVTKGAKMVGKQATQVGGKIAEKTATVTGKLKGVTAPLVEEAKRIPSRIQTNAAQKQAVQQSINQLPSKIAREAAQDGLDIADVKTIYRISKTQKAPLKKLATVVKDFAEGKTKTNPIEVVGKPIVGRIKELEKARGTIGQKLGQTADQLGNVTKQELDDAVFSELKKVPGLNGVKKTMLGELDFSNTTLATELSKTDRVAIRKIFSMATKQGTGKSKHLLRQELFEILGGKKRALTALTDTQERAFEAVRKGLSNVLEGKNASYKSLSNQYRQTIKPLQDIRKLMKVSGEPDDILDMSAGLLARRLTSLAQTNPQIKATLNAMDKATKIGGKTRLNVETLQDFYNILEKYYDIAPKTGFQSQVKQGVEKAIGGPMDFAADKLKSFAGETPAVRQRALEKILEEVLR